MRTEATFKKAVFTLFFLLIFSIPFMPSLSEEKKRFAVVPGETCITDACHSDMTERESFHESAVDGEMCGECHSMPNEAVHAFELEAQGADLCFNCHDESDFTGATLHGPVIEGACLKCHGPHGSDFPSLLKTPEPGLCFKCHDRKLEDTKGSILPSTKETFEDNEMILHRPFAQGRCSECHLPHAAESYRRFMGNYPAEFYTHYTDDSYGSCLRCHGEFKKSISEPRTLTATAFRNGNLNLHYRHVNRAKSRTCRACHRHHGSENPKLVRRSFLFGKRSLTMTYEKMDTGGRCAPGCHVPVRYDRYEPKQNVMKTTPREGKDASPEELNLSRKNDMKGTMK